MQKVELSIIIPVYNCQSWILRCLESVRNQGLNDEIYEIIIVNDGSTDNTSQVLEEWSKSQKNVIIHNQQNQGVSIARNRGIEIASGEYITFIDSDDYLASQGISQLIKIRGDNTPDVILFGHLSVDSNFKEIEKDNNINNIKSKFYTCEEWVSSHWIHGNPWAQLVRREFILKNNLRFKKVKFTEDLLFNVEIFHCLPSVLHIDLNIYRYYENPISAIRSRSQNHWKSLSKDAIIVLEEIKKIIEIENNTILKDAFKVRHGLSTNFFSSLFIRAKFNNKEFQELKPKIISACGISLNNNQPFIKLLKIFLKIPYSYTLISWCYIYGFINLKKLLIYLSKN